MVDNVIRDDVSTNNARQFIDMTTPSDKNVPIEEDEKCSRYECLEFELTYMWKVEMSIMTVVMGACAATKKEMRQRVIILL